MFLLHRPLIWLQVCGARRPAELQGVVLFIPSCESFRPPRGTAGPEEPVTFRLREPDRNTCRAQTAVLHRGDAAGSGGKRSPRSKKTGHKT